MPPVLTDLANAPDRGRGLARDMRVRSRKSASPARCACCLSPKSSSPRIRLQGAGFLEAYPDLVGYIARASARPAYQRAFQAQRQVFMQAQEGHHA